MSVRAVRSSKGHVKNKNNFTFSPHVDMVPWSRLSEASRQLMLSRSLRARRNCRPLLIASYTPLLRLLLLGAVGTFLLWTIR